MCFCRTTSANPAANASSSCSVLELFLLPRAYFARKSTYSALFASVTLYDTAKEGGEETTKETTQEALPVKFDVETDEQKDEKKKGGGMIEKDGTNTQLRKPEEFPFSVFPTILST